MRVLVSLPTHLPACLPVCLPIYLPRNWQSIKKDAFLEETKQAGNSHGADWKLPREVVGTPSAIDRDFVCYPCSPSFCDTQQAVPK